MRGQSDIKILLHKIRNKQQQSIQPIHRPDFRELDRFSYSAAGFILLCIRHPVVYLRDLKEVKMKVKVNGSAPRHQKESVCTD